MDQTTGSEKKTNSSIENQPMLLLDLNSLLEIIQLLKASYQTKNKNEYNKINCILDKLIKI